MRDKNGHLRMNPNVFHKQAKKLKICNAGILDSLYGEGNNLISTIQNVMGPILY